MTKALRQPETVPVNRRSALKSGLALAMTGASATLGFSMPTAAKADDDSVLLARCADFYAAMAERDKADDVANELRARVEAMPNCPQMVAPYLDKGTSHRRWRRFLGRRGVWKLWDAAQEAHRKTGAIANEIFATPAQTLRGAVEKVKIARLATGIGEGSNTRDADLDAYQDYKAPWIDAAIADLERLAGAA